MKYYKDKNNEIRAIGEQGDIDGDQSHLVQDDWIEITKEEMLAITNPAKTEEELTAEKIQESKQYLASTDYKMTVDYFATLEKAEQDNLIKLRAEARESINTLEAELKELEGVNDGN